MRYFMDISYDGTHYHGWQTQPNGVTVQASIEHALSTILKTPTGICGSGRTDAGVHARQQIAHFDSTEALDTLQLTYQLNSFMDKDISINNIRPVRSDAHARYSALSRTYHYYLHQAKDPFKEDQSYYYRPLLDVALINKACQIIKGWQNFECFSKVHTDVDHFNCSILKIEWKQADTNHLFEIQANRFLRGMVRAVVGTLLNIGLHRTSIDEFNTILKSNNRSKAGRAVPAKGLYLQRITYPETLFLN